MAITNQSKGELESLKVYIPRHKTVVIWSIHCKFRYYQPMMLKSFCKWRNKLLTTDKAVTKRQGYNLDNKDLTKRYNIRF